MSAKKRITNQFTDPVYVINNDFDFTLTDIASSAKIVKQEFANLEGVTPSYSINPQQGTLAQAAVIQSTGIDAYFPFVSVENAIDDYNNDQITRIAEATLPSATLTTFRDLNNVNIEDALDFSSNDNTGLQPSNFIDLQNYLPFVNAADSVVISFYFAIPSSAGVAGVSTVFSLSDSTNPSTEINLYVDPLNIVVRYRRNTATLFTLTASFQADTWYKASIKIGDVIEAVVCIHAGTHDLVLGGPPVSYGISGSLGVDNPLTMSPPLNRFYIGGNQDSTVDPNAESPNQWAFCGYVKDFSIKYDPQGSLAIHPSKIRTSVITDVRSYAVPAVRSAIQGVASDTVAIITLIKFPNGMGVDMAPVFGDASSPGSDADFLFQIRADNVKDVYYRQAIPVIVNNNGSRVMGEVLFDFSSGGSPLITLEVNLLNNGSFTGTPSGFANLSFVIWNVEFDFVD